MLAFPLPPSIKQQLIGKYVLFWMQHPRIGEKSYFKVLLKLINYCNYGYIHAEAQNFVALSSTATISQLQDATCQQLLYLAQQVCIVNLT